MMKNTTLPLLAYLMTCAITFFLPTSEAYNTFGWKLLIGQAYAIPVLIVVGLTTFYVNKKKYNNK